MKRIIAGFMALLGLSSQVDANIKNKKQEDGANEPLIIKLEDWPKPNTSPEAIVAATEHGLILRYYAGESSAAIIKFPLVRCFKFGSPNDEALSGHPLKKFGLEYYGVHKVKKSPWISELEKQNSVHSRHNKEDYINNSEHYIFTFQDSTFECVIIAGKHFKPEVKVLTIGEAKEEWQRFISEISWDI